MLSFYCRFSHFFKLESRVSCKAIPIYIRFAESSPYKLIFSEVEITGAVLQRKVSGSHSNDPYYKMFYGNVFLNKQRLSNELILILYSRMEGCSSVDLKYSYEVQERLGQL